MSQWPSNDFFWGQSQSSQRAELPAARQPIVANQRSGTAVAPVVGGGKSKATDAAKGTNAANGGRVGPQESRQAGGKSRQIPDEGVGVFVATCPLEEYAEAWLKLTQGRSTRCQTLNQMQANTLKPSELRAVRMMRTVPPSARPCVLPEILPGGTEVPTHPQVLRTDALALRSAPTSALQIAQVHGLPASLGETRNKAELLERLAGTELVHPFAGEPRAARPRARASPPCPRRPCV